MRIPREFVTLAVAFAVVACKKETPDPKPPPGAPPAAVSPAAAPVDSGIPMTPDVPVAEEHSHDARHGGTILELGKHEGHLEVVHDPATGTLTAYVYDAGMKSVASEAPMINLKNGGVQVPMASLSAGGAAGDAWKAVHDGLKAVPLAGRIRLKIGTKTYQADL